MKGQLGMTNGMVLHRKYEVLASQEEHTMILTLEDRGAKAYPEYR